MINLGFIMINLGIFVKAGMIFLMIGPNENEKSAAELRFFLST